MRAIRGCVSPPVCRSVRPSHTSWIFQNWYFWAEFEQKRMGNMHLCHYKYNSETSTRADPQSVSVVWTLSDLLPTILPAPFPAFLLVILSAFLLAFCQPFHSLEVIVLPALLPHYWFFVFACSVYLLASPLASYFVYLSACWTQE